MKYVYVLKNNWKSQLGGHDTDIKVFSEWSKADKEFQSWISSVKKLGIAGERVFNADGTVRSPRYELSFSYSDSPAKDQYFKLSKADGTAHVFLSVERTELIE